MGQYDARRQDALRDPRTDLPIVLGSGGVYSRAAASALNDFRVDWLFSYRPNPGTVFFAGYGGSLTEPDAFTFRTLRRTTDGLFVKLSYLFRL